MAKSKSGGKKATGAQKFVPFVAGKTFKGKGGKKR